MKKYYLYHWIKGSNFPESKDFPFKYDPETQIAELTDSQIIDLSQNFSVMICPILKEIKGKGKNKEEVWDEMLQIFIDQKGGKFRQR